MKKLYLAIALSVATLVVMLPPDGVAAAQTIVALPAHISAQAWTDLGNGPAEVLALEGSAQVETSQGSGVGSTSGASTTLTLTATPAVAPCVGCIITGAGITAGTTVAAFNGTTTITLSAAMTVASSTALSWGAACPTSGSPTNPVANLRSALGNAGNVPFYTDARLCAYGGMQGGTVTTFPVGAW